MGSALLVIVVQPDDVAIAAHPAIAPRDAETLLETRAEEFHALLQERRTAARRVRSVATPEAQEGAQRP